ncbi:hypothetical protein ABZW30_46005 [Kitasatospora sp. NPDC004669]|uniref:hypothetical protein n=1 Tax=Kitasatospora sp. NPDC004669 TaxID=3154555 RepID=UPI0033BDABDA
MSTRPGAPADLHHLRALTATTLATALAHALTTGDRFADAQGAIRPATLTGDEPPGHTDLVRRECVFRLAYAAQLYPISLLVSDPMPSLESRDRLWPRPVRRDALLCAAAQLPHVPSRAMGPATRPTTSTSVTDRLQGSIRAAAQVAAVQLRSGTVCSLTKALNIAARDASRYLPSGYDALIEREMTLRLALTLNLSATGALAPSLDFALAHATRSISRSDLADLILGALRPVATGAATSATQAARRLTRVPRQSSGACGCACSRGGFCGGCGHAGCGGRK